MGAVISPGEIRVNEVWRVVDEPRARVWEADLASKYAEILVIEGDTTVLLRAGEYTLHLDEERRGMPTRVTLPVPEGWTLMAEVSRYTLRAVAYRPTYGSAGG